LAISLSDALAPAATLVSSSNLYVLGKNTLPLEMPCHLLCDRHIEIHGCG
jgi:hypothetical protein